MERQLIKAIYQPQSVNNFSTEDWNKLLVQARASNLLGRLCYIFQQQKIDLPERMKNHLESAWAISNKQKMQTLFEIREILRATDKIEENIVVLKGAAYCALKLPCSEGRTFSDIDIMVAKNVIRSVEVSLLLNGWVKTVQDDYDQQYYRQWMHEIPPLRHSQRDTVIDVHHNILPLTNQSAPDSKQFKLREIHLDDIGLCLVLDELDMLIHCCVHLFAESEFNNSLRDLSDIYMMLQGILEKDPEALSKLLVRADELGLGTYVKLAIRNNHKVFSLPLSADVKQRLSTDKMFSQRIVNWCFQQLFVPNHSSCRTMFTPIAEFLLYIRGHRLRMPLRLLLPHLYKKASRNIKTLFEKDTVEPI
ncbi:MAG: hypothetical protein ACI808_001519 [Paraglaciecola sp.]